MPSHPRFDPIDPSRGPRDGRPDPSRRRWLHGAVSSLALAGGPTWAQGGSPPRVEMPPIAAPTEPPQTPPPLPDPPSRRVGFALVGLGRLTLEQLLPAFGRSRHCKLVALVSGDRAKATTIARQFDIPDASVYDYAGFDRIAANPAVEVVYIVLPNSLHAEFTVRAARAGKHVLCEKPMAVSSRECRQMIDACKAADRKLMVAYRSQYEPNNRAVVQLVKDGKLGALKEFISTNSQNMGDPQQWRLRKAMAGGGPLPDVGIYCLNTVRFLSGEEPSEVLAWMHAPPNDPRFTEVEESLHFSLRFPSGLEATCHTSYGAHKSQMYRLMGTAGWVEMNPAYAYHGNLQRQARVEGGKEVRSEPAIEEQSQFALEMDHMAQCVRSGRAPHSSGEDGLQDQTIIEAIYESARANGKPVRLALPAQPVRGPEPQSETA